MRSNPEVGTLVKINDTAFSVVVTPVTLTPLLSYPAGGWTRYDIEPELDNLGQGTYACT